MFQTVPQKKLFSRLGLCFFIGSAAVYGVQLLMARVLDAFFPGVRQDDTAAFVLSGVSMYLIAMPLMAFLISRIPRAVLPADRRLGPGQLLGLFCAAYAISYICNLLGNIITFFFSWMKGSPIQNELSELMNSIDIPLLFLVAVFCAPIWEEMLFRKLLIDRTIQYGAGISVLLSGLIFGLFHGNITQFAYAFPLGALFAFIYVKTGRIRYTIFLHMLVNSVAVGAVALLDWIDYDRLASGFFNKDGAEGILEWLAEAGPKIAVLLLYLAVILAVVFLGIILLLTGLKKFRLPPCPEELPRGKRFQMVFGNPGMLLFAAFWLFMIVRQIWN